MTDTEQKALALLNECGWGGAHLKRTWNPRYEALCRAIEQHEAFRQEVSDAIQALKKDVGTGWDHSHFAYACNRFIITKPDPLAEALLEIEDGRYGPTVGSYAACLRAAIEKRGGKIVWGEG